MAGAILILIGAGLCTTATPEGIPENYSPDDVIHLIAKPPPFGWYLIACQPLTLPPHPKPNPYPNPSPNPSPNPNPDPNPSQVPHRTDGELCGRGLRHDALRGEEIPYQGRRRLATVTSAHTATLDPAAALATSCVATTAPLTVTLTLPLPLPLPLPLTRPHPPRAARSGGGGCRAGG